MIIDSGKKEIIREILKTEDEQVLKAIRNLLNLEVENISEDHKSILSERIAEYESGTDDVIDWEQLKKDLMKD